VTTTGGTDNPEARDDEVLDAVITPARSRGATIAIWVVSGVAVLALAVVAWVWIIGVIGGDAVSRYLDGHGPTYEGDGFRARFPTTPSRVEERSPLGTVAIVSSTPRPDLRFSVTAADAPTDAANDPSTALNAAAAALVLDSKGTFVNQQEPGVLGPAASKNFTYRVGTTIFRSSMLLTVSRLYTTQVSGTAPTKAQFEALTQSFGLSPVG
jgi:hypothetical protein